MEGVVILGILIIALLALGIRLAPAGAFGSVLLIGFPLLYAEELGLEIIEVAAISLAGIVLMFLFADRVR